MGKIIKRAIFKICTAKGNRDYKKKSDVKNVINYILRQSKRSDDNIWNSIRIYNESKEGIIKDFYRLKRLYDKTDGVQIKHLILSWGTRPDIPRKKLRKLIKQTMNFWGKDYQLVYAIHEDNSSDKWHMHFAINSVSNNGYKIQITRKTLTRFERKFNIIWNPYGCVNACCFSSSKICATCVISITLLILPTVSLSITLSVKTNIPESVKICCLLS